MQFTVEFYETDAGKSPVQEFLLKRKATDPDDFAAVAAGLEKLRYRQYHREPLSKALGGGLFELRHVGKLNTRVLWFFRKGRRIIAVHGVRNKGQAIPRRDMDTARTRMRDWIKRTRDDEDEF
jgi:phage-related protein